MLLKSFSHSTHKPTHNTYISDKKKTNISYNIYQKSIHHYIVSVFLVTLSDPNQLIGVCATKYRNEKEATCLISSWKNIYRFRYFIYLISSWCILKKYSAAFCCSLPFWHVHDDGCDTHKRRGRQTRLLAIWEIFAGLPALKKPAYT